MGFGSKQFSLLISIPVSFPSCFPSLSLSVSICFFSLLSLFTSQRARFVLVSWTEKGQEDVRRQIAREYNLHMEGNEKYQYRLNFYYWTHFSLFRSFFLCVCLLFHYFVFNLKLDWNFRVAQSIERDCSSLAKWNTLVLLLLLWNVVNSPLRLAFELSVFIGPKVTKGQNQLYSLLTSFWPWWSHGLTIPDRSN